MSNEKKILTGPEREQLLAEKIGLKALQLPAEKNTKSQQSLPQLPKIAWEHESD